MTPALPENSSASACVVRSRLGATSLHGQDRPLAHARGIARWTCVSHHYPGHRTNRETQKAPAGPFDIYTASFAALTGRALTIFRAGFALKVIGSPLKGFTPLRALVAAFLM